MKKEMICIICPRGCGLSCTKTDDGITVSGNACPKGKEYAICELTRPTRTVTSVVRVAGKPDTMVSVKTADPIPKSKIMEVMDRIRNTTVNPPVAIGDVILSDVFGTDIIATKAVNE